MARKMSLATSALNRLLNLYDQLDAPAVPDPAPLGAVLEAGLAPQPGADMPAVPGIEDALVTKGLGLQPPV